MWQKFANLFNPSSSNQTNTITILCVLKNTAAEDSNQDSVVTNQNRKEVVFISQRPHFSSHSTTSVEEHQLLS